MIDSSSSSSSSAIGSKRTFEVRRMRFTSRELPLRAPLDSHESGVWSDRWHFVLGNGEKSVSIESSRVKCARFVFFFFFFFFFE